MTTSTMSPLVVSDEVQSALDEGRAVVALETTIVVHGLPRPMNLEVARACEQQVRDHGAVPATIGVLDGRAIVGLTFDQIEQLADPARPAVKLSARDIGVAIASGISGATTVAGTIALAHLAGIGVMATGGLGGVHRGASTTYDESADLTCLARTPVLVVASGVKSILDIPATLERLDTLGVPIIGFGTSRFPGFYLHDSGHDLEWRLDNARDVARAFGAHRLVSSTGMFVANPVAKDSQLDPSLHDDALSAAFAYVADNNVSGKEVTPALLGTFASFTKGESVRVNRDLVLSNCAVAGEVASALANGPM